MSQRKITLAREFMAVMTNHWTFFPFVFVYAAVSELSGMAFLGWILAGFAPLFLALIRNTTQSILLQLCCYPIFMGVLAVLPIEPEMLKGIYFFFTTIYLLFSIYKTLTGKSGLTKILPPFVAMGIHFVCAFVIFPNMEIYHYPYFLLVGLILTGLFFFFAFYIDQYLSFVIKNEETSSSMPKSKIFCSGMKLSLAYLGLGSLFLFFVSVFGISDEFLHGFWGRVKELIRKFISFLASLFKPGDSDIHFYDGMGDPSQFPPAVEGSTSLLWRILEVLLFYLVILILLAFFAYILYKIIVFFLQRLPQKELYEAEEEVEDLDIHESLDGKQSPFLTDSEKEGFLSPRQRIRRIFKQRAQRSNFLPGQLPFLTARDVASSQRNPALSHYYEKARYSPFEIEKEDVKALMKSFQKHGVKDQNDSSEREE